MTLRIEVICPVCTTPHFEMKLKRCNDGTHSCGCGYAIRLRDAN